MINTPSEYIGHQRFKNVLLCTFPVKRADMRMPMMPYCGIGYVAEALRRNGIRYHFVDLRFKSSKKRFFNLIDQIKPDLISTAIFSQGYRYSYAIIEEIKTSFPKVSIVVGGPHVSCFKEKMLEDCPAIDYGIALEGDDAIVDLCRASSPEAIKGLLYRDDGKVKYNGDRPFILDLDRLGFPLYEGFDLERYAINSIPIHTSRGCYGECTFCAVANSHGRKIRKRSAELVAEEISYWYRKGYRMIQILDDNFIVDRARVFALCDILQSKALKGLQIKLNGVRADCVDEDILKAMFAIGVNKLCFGVESANDNILKNIKKGESIAKIENAVRLALKVGMQVHLTFIIGLPGETEREIRNSFTFAERLGVHNAQFFNLIPYPKSELFEWAKDSGYLLYEPEMYLNNIVVDPKKEAEALLDTPELSKLSRERLYREGRRTTRRIERKRQTSLLEPIVGKFLAKLLILVYTSNIFEKLFDRSFVVKRYVFRLRSLLNV